MLISRIVEPMIALSIAYVEFTSVFSGDNLFVGGSRSKMVAIFFFGLFHGLGFAGLLREINIPADKFVSSLLSFNLGIEGGQLVIVGIAFPIIYAFRHKIWYPKFIRVFSVLIIAIAIYWFIERVMNI
ncbi:HupE/UreJ family protein [Candidatus Gracilibacteria bacterium]|nr:HupE/UreJ family protein [Candidatus Gracilibacteria bacterium]